MSIAFAGPQKAARHGDVCVLVGELNGSPILLRYAPTTARHSDLREACRKAAGWLGFKPDRRFKTGWRKVGVKS